MMKVGSSNIIEAVISTGQLRASMHMAAKIARCGMLFWARGLIRACIPSISTATRRAPPTDLVRRKQQRNRERNSASGGSCDQSAVLLLARSETLRPGYRLTVSTECERAAVGAARYSWQGPFSRAALFDFGPRRHFGEAACADRLEHAFRELLGARRDRFSSLSFTV